MSFASRARQVAAALSNKSNQSTRDISKQTTIPKSSVYRHRAAMKKRIASVGHNLYETEIGYKLLQRLYFAVIFVFGIVAGVGAETISIFFNIMLLTSYLATSPTVIRNIKTQMRQLIVKYDASMMDKVFDLCKNKDLHLGGDETFFDGKLFLIIMELTSGFIFSEALTTDRQCSTWKSVTNSCISNLKQIASMAVDRGRSILKFAKGITTVTMDLFHLLQDVTSAFGAQFTAKHRSMRKQEKAAGKNISLSDSEKQTALSEINQKRQDLIKGEKGYKNSLFSISTACHPFIGINQYQTSVMLHHNITGTLTALRSIMTDCNLNDKRNLINRCENRLAELTALNDLWFQWVDAALHNKTQDVELQSWAKYYLLPYCYWKWQLSKSKRKKNMREHYQQKVNSAKAALESHPMSSSHLNDDWLNWGNAMSRKYQRTTSAVEGRNARLSDHYFSSKGVRAQHVQPLTAIHNFWLKRADGTTACERLTGIKPTSLFEWLLTEMGDMPVPRKS